jgi:hypothetical protein
VISERVQQLQDYFSRLRTSYIRVFPTQNPDVQTVLADLARFCRANEPAFHEDPRKHALLEGRREVFLRISKHLNLTDEQLWAIHKLNIPKE